MPRKRQTKPNSPCTTAFSVTALVGVFLAACAPLSTGAGGTGAIPPQVPMATRNEAPTDAGDGPATAANTGAFSPAQADRGKDVFKETCSECHFTSEMRNADFQFSWKRRTAWDLHREIVRDMPEDDPGSLTKQQYIDVTAYILQLNGHSTGPAELVRDEAVLRAIPVNKPAGTQP